MTIDVVQYWHSVHIYKTHRPSLLNNNLSFIKKPHHDILMFIVFTYATTTISNPINRSTFTTCPTILTYSSDIITTTNILIKTLKRYYHKYFSLQRGRKSLAPTTKLQHSLGHNFTNYTDHSEWNLQ